MRIPLVVKTKDGKRGVIVGMKVNSDERNPISFVVKMPNGEVKYFTSQQQKSAVVETATVS